MTTVLKNKYAETGFPNDPILLDPKMIVRTDVEAVKVVVDACLKPEKSPLIKSNLAGNIGIHSLWFKDERNRMNMGSFKAIGATYVLAREASEKIGLNASEDDLKKGEILIQEVTDQHVEKVDSLLREKEKDLLEI